MHCKVEVKRFLLDRGADINPKRGTDPVVLITAAGNGCVEVVKGSVGQRSGCQFQRRFLAGQH